MPTDDSLDDVWDTLQFIACESLLLRSFLEYLRMWPDPPEKKQERLQKWRTEVGLQMGNPLIVEKARELFQIVRAAPPEMRRTVLQRGLAAMGSTYFDGSQFKPSN
jgi:hypothetical protein